MSNTSLVLLSFLLIGSVFSTAHGVLRQTSQMKKGIVSYVLYKHQGTSYKPEVRLVTRR